MAQMISHVHMPHRCLDFFVRLGPAIGVWGLGFRAALCQSHLQAHVTWNPQRDPYGKQCPLDRDLRMSTVVVCQF